MATKRDMPKGKRPVQAGRDSIKFLVPPEEYARAAIAQRQWLTDIARKIEHGEPLNPWDRTGAAAVLRAWATRIPDREPRGRGQAPKIDAGNVSIHYACLVNGHGMKPSKAVEELAEGNGVSIEAIKKAVKKYGEAALRMIPRNPNLKKE
jgi:hypothetical protein